MTNSHEGRLAARASLVQVEPGALVLSAVKEAEDGRGIVVRLWNSSEDPCEGIVRFWTPPVRVTTCTLGERDLEQLSPTPQGVPVALRGRQVLSVRAQFA